MSALVDRLALRVMERIFLATRRPSRRAPSKDERRSFETYSDPAHAREPGRTFPEPPPPSPSRRLISEARGGRIESLRFESGHRTLDPARQERWDSFTENRTVHVRALLHDSPAPAVVCLHAWMGGRAWYDDRVLEARKLFRSGLDVYLMTMPFHGKRTPRGVPLGGALFPSPNVARTAEAFRQAVRDARGVRAIARAAGSPSVGVLGMSLGGYTTALLAGLDACWSFAVPFVPLVSMADALWEHGEHRPERAAAERHGITLDVLRAAFALHCPLSYPLRLPPEKVAIVAGRTDRICPPATIERLWDHWGRPKIVWFAGGHLLQTGRRRAMTEALAGVGAGA